MQRLSSFQQSTSPRGKGAASISSSPRGTGVASIKSPKAARRKKNPIPSCRTTLTSLISPKMGNCCSALSSPSHHGGASGASAGTLIKSPNHKLGFRRNRRAKAADEKEQAWLTKLEKDRREGRALLREMVIKSDDVDWKAVIDQADSLHQKEQRRLRKQERRNRRKEKKQRKSLDAVGSFSVNLLTLKQSEEDSNAVLRWRSRVSFNESRQKARSDATNSVISDTAGEEDLDFTSCNEEEDEELRVHLVRLRMSSVDDDDDGDQKIEAKKA